MRAFPVPGKTGAGRACPGKTCFGRRSAGLELKAGESARLVVSRRGDGVFGWCLGKGCQRCGAGNRLSRVLHGNCHWASGGDCRCFANSGIGREVRGGDRGTLGWCVFPFAKQCRDQIPRSEGQEKRV